MQLLVRFEGSKNQVVLGGSSYSRALLWGIVDGSGRSKPEEFEIIALSGAPLRLRLSVVRDRVSEVYEYLFTRLSFHSVARVDFYTSGGDVFRVHA